MIGLVASAPAAKPFPDVEPIDFGGPARLPADAAADQGEVDGPSRDRLVVLFDRDCGLCTASARALRRWDRHGRLELLPLQDAAVAGRPALESAVRELPLLAALHVVDEATGQIRAGGDAALAIGAVLPGGRIVRALAAIPPFRWAVGIGYRVVARHRRRIGRWLRLEGPTCELPR